MKVQFKLLRTPGSVQQTVASRNDEQPTPTSTVNLANKSSPSSTSTSSTDINPSFRRLQDLLELPLEELVEVVPEEVENAIAENDEEAPVQFNKDAIRCDSDNHIVCRLWRTLTYEQKQHNLKSIPHLNSRITLSQQSSHRYNSSLPGDGSYIGPVFLATDNPFILKPGSSLGTFSAGLLRRVDMGGGVVVQRMGLAWGVLLAIEADTSVEDVAGWLREKDEWCISHPREFPAFEGLIQTLPTAAHERRAGLYFRSPKSIVSPTPAASDHRGKLYTGMTFEGTIGDRQPGHWGSRKNPGSAKLAQAYEDFPDKQDWRARTAVIIPTMWRGQTLGKAFTYCSETLLICLFDSISDSHGLNTRMVDKRGLFGMDPQEVEVVWRGFVSVCDGGRSLPARDDATGWSTAFKQIMPTRSLKPESIIRLLRCETYKAFTVPLAAQYPLPGTAWSAYKEIPYSRAKTPSDLTAWRVAKDEREKRDSGISWDEDQGPARKRTKHGFVPPASLGQLIPASAKRKESSRGPR